MVHVDHEATFVRNELPVWAETNKTCNTDVLK